MCIYMNGLHAGSKQISSPGSTGITGVLCSSPAMPNTGSEVTADGSILYFHSDSIVGGL